MLLGLQEALRVGEEVVLTLEFANARAIDVVVPVSASDPGGDTPDPSHHDH
jgi:copper(I)-binding protein